MGPSHKHTSTPASRQMDYAPKSQRGRWSSLDAVTSFGWSGSALLGGFVISRHGFSAVFYVTACMQLASLLTLCLLLPLVPRREAARAPSHC
jgi:predicted MFS family arabinose efflux permease